MRRQGSRSGQAAMEFAILYGAVMLPLTFMLIFVSQMLWVWHSVCDFTRDGARYAATHCWQSDGSNVTGYMQANVPAMIDQAQFQSGSATITVTYYQQDVTSGALEAFTCEYSDCSIYCIPDAVSVSVSNYQFQRFSSYFKLANVTIPPFTASMPMHSAGFDETGTLVQ